MIVYRRYASLFFIVGVNSSFVYCRQNIGDNLLGIYEFIHCAVEALDEYFENVCEIDVMFNVEKVHIVFDEMLSNGYICEINKKNILCPLELGE
ncbi:AP-4 complex subunit sigma-1 [Angomonas deanei]|uniref:AP complex subunit sigma n=1 Tax=Angomonas deanei TaxID=59799 RepID=A0A7G2CBX5_9TRYP|nr:AP-4 complex subunit sigma-1 [Angomonas deanei]CAD2216447.1 Clathrin adaptor complex small chain, putative [Angomonas deanei]|eukprot:EPY42135.1 AP-4 complex subunit sigma-1 [Angomonas deanei]